jgi:hypothetical protein
VNVAEIDVLIGKLQRVGQAGALPKNMTQPQLIDELQRELGALAQAANGLLAELRASPRYGKDAQLFLVDCRTGGNILTTTQATNEGYGAVAGLAVYHHGLRYRLDRAEQVYFAYTPTVGVVDGQATQGGTCCIHDFDDQRTVFQVDQNAVTNGAVFVMTCYPSIAPASAVVNPGANTKTGAASPQLGLISAIASTQLP